RTEELGEPRGDEVRVRALLSAISHGTEMLVYRGEVDADLALDLPTLAGGYAFPLKYGYASVGRVVAIGRDVRGVREGDVVVEPSALRRSFAERCAAETAIAPGGAALIRELTGGRGADIAIDASGSPAALQEAIDCVAPEGTVVVCSWYGEKPVPLDLGGLFHRRRVRLVSSQVGRIDPSLAPRWDRERRLDLATELLGELILEDLITHRIPFARAAEAYVLLDSQAAETVQVVLDYA